MKTILCFCFALATLISVPACTTVEDHRPPTVRSTTTTTEQSSFRQPSSATTETQTTRVY